MQSKELIEAGLTKNQANVYLEVLQHPGQSGGQIAKKVSIDRSFVYGILSSLADKGLISHVTKGNVRLFYPNDPENLLKDIEEKRGRLLTVVENLKKINETTKPEKSVRVYEGKAGLKAFIRSLLEAKSFSTLGGGRKLTILEALKYEYPHYLKEFIKKKIKGRLITSPENKETVQKIYANTEFEVRTFKNIKNEVNFTIFEDKIGIYSAEEKPFVIIIEDKNIQESLKTYFDLLWERAEKYA